MIRLSGQRELIKTGGQYDPALYDYAFRITAVVYFTDVTVEGMNQDQLSELAFSAETTNMMNEAPRKYILSSLIEGNSKFVLLQRSIKL